MAGVESIRLALPCAPPDQGLDRIAILTTSGDASALLSELQANSNVEYAEPRPERHTQAMREREQLNAIDGVPNDPYFAQQWSLERMHLAAAWDITRGSPNAIVAVIDLGVDFTHPELIGQDWINTAEQNGQPGIDDDNNGYIDDIHGWDFVDNDGDPAPRPLAFSESHGTHVSGTIAALRNNGRGITGIAPDCKIMAIRAGVGGSIPYGYEGIYYACRSGAKIINCSWGGGGESAFERDIINYAIAHDCIVVAAAGNSPQRDPLPFYPAAIEGVLSVAATDWNDLAANFTHYGPWVKVSAPGVSIISPVIGPNGEHTYDTWQGTSMAAPHVAGVCALVAAINPTLTAGEITARVLSTSVPIDAVNPSLLAGGLGLGRVDAWNALTLDYSGAVQLTAAQITETAGDLDGRIEPGESCDLHLTVQNGSVELAGLRATASTTRDSIIFSSPLCFWNSLPAGASRTSATAMTLHLPADARRGRTIPLNIDFTTLAGAAIGRATHTLIIDTTYVLLRNSVMQLGMAEHGSLGYYDYRDRRYIGPGLSLQTERPFGTLYHGSFVLAADGYVSDNFYGDTTRLREDWVMLPDSFARTVPSSRAAQETRCNFTDRGAAENELFASVTASGLAYADGFADHFLILEYAVANRSINHWQSAYAGLALDWDIAGGSRNYSAFDPIHAMAIASPSLSEYPQFAVVALRGPLTGYYAIDNRAELDSAGYWSDARKWELLSSGVHSSASDARDISQLVSIGPFSLAAGNDTTFAFALLWGDNALELQQAADSARVRYGVPVLAGGGPAELPSVVRVSPNPVSALGTLTLHVSTAQTIDISLYNVLGQKVLARTARALPDGTVKLELASAQVSTGLFFYNISYGGQTHIGKLLIVR